MEAKHANALLTLITQTNMSIALVMSVPHAIEAIAELQNTAADGQSPVGNVYIWCDAGKTVEAIKLIRNINGIGLKEAKDLFDTVNPRREEGWYGPITHAVPEAVNAHLERFGYVPKEVVQYR